MSEFDIQRFHSKIEFCETEIQKLRELALDQNELVRQTRIDAIEELVAQMERCREKIAELSASTTEDRAGRHKKLSEEIESLTVSLEVARSQF